jgi:hypothetical protein
VWAHQIENILVSEFHNLGHALSHFGRCLRPPSAQPGIQLFNQRIHACVLPRFSLALIAHATASERSNPAWQ